MKLKKGTTRYVILFENFVIKIPSFYSWKNFLLGIVANLQEVTFWNAFKHEKLCPIILNINGFIIIMPKAKELTFEEFKTFNYNEFIDIDTWKIPVENKLNSFGKIKNKIVAVDYGT